MTKLIMILLGLTCSSLHQPSDTKEVDTTACSSKTNMVGEDIVHFSLFQSVIN